MSVHMEQRLPLHGLMDFHEFLYRGPLLKPAEQMQGCWLKLGKNTGHKLGRTFMIP